jgi:hypothetical protein
LNNLLNELASAACRSKLQPVMAPIHPLGGHTAGRHNALDERRIEQPAEIK